MAKKGTQKLLTDLDLSKLGDIEELRVRSREAHQARLEAEKLESIEAMKLLREGYQAFRKESQKP